MSAWVLDPVSLVITVVTLLVSVTALVYSIRQRRLAQRAHDAWIAREMQAIKAEREARRG